MERLSSVISDSRNGTIGLSGDWSARCYAASFSSRRNND